MKFWKNPTYIFYTFLFLYFIGMIALSFFRDMIKDESLYFRETWLISELLKNGKWIGEYAVGLHGFIFKLPPAIIFLFTGPSIQVVTIYNIVLSIGVGYLFYKIAREFLKDNWYAVWATIFLMVNFHFFLNVPTYMREIPSLLIILLFMLAVLKNWNKYWLSLIFLLLLDTKEYVFLVFAIFYIIWIFVISKRTFFKKVLHLTIVFIPSLIWILLMFLTNIIPVNMYFASIVGLIDDSLGYTLKHFDLDFTSVNLIEEGKTMPLIPVDGIASPILLTLVNIVNAILSLIGKVLYPRTFSFLSVPKVVIFPVIFTSILVLKRFFKERKGTKVLIFSSLLILVWMVFYILRSSHGRYLLPIVPVISIMFIYFLFYSKFTDIQKKILIAGTGIFMVLGFLFESSYVGEKIGIELILYILLCIFTFKPKLTYLKYIFLSFLIVVCTGVALLFSYTQGQIHDYLNWGENREAEEISKAIPDNQKYWINNYENQNVVAVFEQEEYSPPEWKWDLDPKIKEYRELSTLGEKYGYNFDLYDMQTFKENVEELGIRYVIFLKSEVKGDEFDDEEYIETMKNESWLRFKEEIPLEGKELVIFELNQ